MAACKAWFLELTVVRGDRRVEGTARILLREDEIALGLRHVVWEADRIADAPSGQ